ncbi:MAG: hypothetical protein INF75_00140 [Roseomonas sp.]|nr:hypothetical protein [Roseomonas sp.]MCA3327660.1 hypothetical protein [Roseomonas sp.]MCA3330669.1 hypothetical protein [Roseomonas sp.]MCA3334158.1 hypothetical protein [Roseomonas sp.]MCA3348822.1 hypothetical protein [Roseomonas sp.]
MSGTDTAQSGAQVDPAYRRKPPTALLDQIEQLQRDGLLLLDHLTKRSGRRFTQSDTIVPKADQDNAKGGQPPAPGSPQGAPGPAAPQAAPAPAAPQAMPAQASAAPRDKIDDLSLEPLTLSPKEVADKKHGEGLRDLVLLVDALARMADPVTPTTIRNSRNGFLKSLDLLILAILLICFSVSIALLWRADEARNLVTQLRQTQTAANDVYARLRLLTAAEHFAMECGGAKRSCDSPAQNQPVSQVNQSLPNNGTSPGQTSNRAAPTPNDAATAGLKYLPFCRPARDAAGKEKQEPFLAPRSREAEGLCSSLAQHQIREELLFGRLQAWNCSLSQDSPQHLILNLLVKRISDGPGFDFANCPDSSVPGSQVATEANCSATGSPSAASDCASASITARSEGHSETRDPIKDWRKSEIRTIAILSLLMNHLLPALLALLGACVYLLRLRFRQRAQSALETMGYAGTFARLLMPAVMGGLLSVVWSGGDVINPTTVTISDLSLSLTFMAFLLGYAFDPVLEWLESKIRETFLKLNGETKEVKVQ